MPISVHDVGFRWFEERKIRLSNLGKVGTHLDLDSLAGNLIAVNQAQRRINEQQCLDYDKSDNIAYYSDLMKTCRLNPRTK